MDPLEHEESAPAGAQLSVEVSYDPRVNLAQQQNDVPVVKQLRLNNQGELALENLLVRVEIQDGLSGVWEGRISSLAPGATHSFDRVGLPMDPSRLRAQTEREASFLVIQVFQGGAELLRQQEAIEVLAWNEWGGGAVLPEVISAFVLPNSAAVDQILGAARPHLMRLVGSDALSGYQSGDPSRVAAMVEAVWLSLAELGIAYINPPASFEERGQKLRLPDVVASSRLGTCIDLVLLAASVLEQIGLHPLIILTKGHALAGVWTHESSLSEATVFEPSLLLNRVHIGEILIFETVLLTERELPSFSEACAVGKRKLDRREEFRFAVDVARSRSLHIRPIPLRREVESEAVSPALNPADGQNDPQPTASDAESLPVEAERRSIVPEKGPARVETWKRKLLDLSLNNRLLKFRDTGRTLPLMVPDLARLEDLLQEGASLLVDAPPGIALGEGPRDLEALKERVGEDVLDEMIAAEVEKSTLTSSLTPAALDKRLVKLFREARSTELETGSNGLFLVLGMLSWLESEESEIPCKAPILLLPVRLTRRRGGEGFEVALTGEDPRINVTLLEKMRTEFSLDVEGLDELPEDSSGVDIPLVLGRFRERIKNKARWSVEEEAWLAILQFRKFALWRDLQVHSDALLSSPVVAHLVNRVGEVYEPDAAWPEARDLDSELAPGDLICPLDADSSQLCAVQAAGEGRSFVLQGPPGTGKSQTITNLIANTLAKGQRVLFVAEKAAALDVVQRRLESIGLGPACLALHSTKGGKREVMEQLRRATEWLVPDEVEGWETRLQRLAAAREELNAYVAEIHQRHPLGQSLYDAAARLAELGPGPSPKWEGFDPLDLPEGDAAELRDLVATFATAVKSVGLRPGHPLSSVGLEEWYPGLEDEARSALKELDQATEALVSARRSLIGSQGFLPEAAPPECEAGLEAELQLAEALLDHPGTPLALLSEPGWRDLRAEMEERVAQGKERDEKLDSLRQAWRDSFLREDPEAWRLRLEQAERSWGPMAWWRRRKIRSTLGPHLRGGGSLDLATALPQSLDELESYQSRRKELATASQALERFLGPRFVEEGAPWERAAAMLDHAERLRRALGRCSEACGDAAPELRAAVLRLAGEERDRLNEGPLRDRLEELRSSSLSWQKARDALELLLILDSNKERSKRWEPGFLGRCAETTAEIREELRSLRAWCGFRRARALVEKRGGRELVAQLLSGTIEASRIEDSSERGLLSAFLRTLIRRSARLRHFSRDEHQRQIERFRRLDEELIEASAAIARARVARGIPKPGTSPAGEAGLLMRELKKKARHIPLRRLFERLPNLLPRLKPCLLMSPIAVAQYLGPRWPKADVVVFDEASQMPVWDAIGALGRGQSAVVVGDSKQLPPTTFFSQGADSDEEVDEGEIRDLESILDEFDAAGFASRRLRWHYRSQHESLIVFSNHHYYEDDLVTFPSANADAGALGVHLRLVSGAVYDRGKTRTNRGEAEAIAAEVVSRLLSAAARGEGVSLGIVAFSKPQANLIEDLLDEARGEHPEIEDFFNEEEEPLFVKNLENVQGDERDAIFFSICYGPDESGFVGMNFGPLNLAGGERRLNVAITRARRELLVFSSLGADRIDLRRTRSEAIKHLRSFLDFAARGTRAIGEVISDPSEGPKEGGGVEKAVARALREWGHTVELGVGCSQQRIDLAIRDPEDADRYLLGIECDGANYAASATARDRDRIREGVLGRLGWRLHRVWATDWWHDPEREVDRIEALLAERPVDPPAEPTESVVRELPVEAEGASPAPPEEPASSPSLAPEQTIHYTRFTLPRTGKAVSQDDPQALAEFIVGIVNSEGPILGDLLDRRVAQACGRSRVSAGFRELVAEAASRSSAATQIVWTDACWWPKTLDPESWRAYRPPKEGDPNPRSVGDIGLSELANAAEAVLARAFGISEEQLLKETAALFKVGRVGARVRARLQEAVERLIAEGRAIRQGETIALP